MSEQGKFMAQLAQARETGLVDQKYFFQPDKAMKPEEIYKAMNEFDDASKNGRRHKRWSGNSAAE